MTLPPLKSRVAAKGAGVRPSLDGSALLQSGKRTRPNISIGQPEDSSGRRAVPGSFRQGACTELLLTGHVEAFSMLFALTTEAKDSQNVEKLRVLQKHLMRAEDAQRTGDQAAAFEANKALADYHEQSGELETAMKFRIKCRGLAGTPGGDPHRQIEALHLQGLSLEKREQFQDALAAFEAMHALTAQQGGADPPNAAMGHGEACTCLARVLAALGQQASQRGEVAAAIDLHTRSMAAAVEGGFADQVAKAAYHLGLLHEVCDQPALVLEYLERYLESAVPKDAMQHSKACACVSRAHAALGDVQLAAKYLEKLVQSATELDQPGIIVEATSRFGALCSKQNKEEEAVRWYEAAYQAAMQVNEVSLVDQCRVQLGLAKAHVLGARLEQQIMSPDGLASLLAWKEKGTPFPYMHA